MLDVACGTGALTLAFAERCGSSVGLDIMAPALAQARSLASERGLVNVEFTLGELERMPFGDGQFTGAACRFSFHHIVNPARVFAEMARVVGPRGWMIIADMTASGERPGQGRARIMKSSGSPEIPLTRARSPPRNSRRFSPRMASAP